MLHTFYWLVDGDLAGCSRPGIAQPHQRRPGDGLEQTEAREAVARDLAWLRAHGIGAVLTLTETPLDDDVVAQQGLVALHLPVPDMQAPAPDQFMSALSFIDRQRARGRAVAVHCLVGQGRTGTILAAYRVRTGAGVDAALRELRGLCPGAVGSPVQEQALHAFARRRDWII